VLERWKGRDKAEEDVTSYWMTLSKTDTGVQREATDPLCPELAVQEAVGPT